MADAILFVLIPEFKTGDVGLGSSLIPDLCLLEVVRHTQRRNVDVVPLVGGEIDLVRTGGLAKVRHLGDETAILRSDIEARADLIGNAAAVKAAVSSVPMILHLLLVFTSGILRRTFFAEPAAALAQNEIPVYFEAS